MSVEKYKINVNGKEYYVEVEMVDEKPAHLNTTHKTETKAATAVSASSSDVAVNAPMQGNIFKVECAVNQEVKAGDVLVILEAMKMENEIVAPVSGIVTNVAVSVGNTVEPGALLVSIKEA